MASARSIVALIRRRSVHQKAPLPDRATLRARVDVDLVWKRTEDSRRSDRIFQTSFRADRFFETEPVRLSQVARHSLSRGRVRRLKRRPQRLSLPENASPD